VQSWQVEINLKVFAICSDETGFLGLSRDISRYPSNYRALLIRDLHDVDPLVRLGPAGLGLSTMPMWCHAILRYGRQNGEDSGDKQSQGMVLAGAI